MDKYYKLNSEIISIQIPIKLNGHDWSLCNNVLKNFIMVYEEDTRENLLHKHVLAQIVLRVDKKLDQIARRLDYNEKKIINLKVTVAEKLALEHYFLDFQLHFINKFTELVVQEIINQLHKFDTNLPERFSQLITANK